jgi:hypothetical protein
MSSLDKYVSVHNIGEERNVGMVNYELSIRGKGNLESVSKKVLINKSSDLLSVDPLRKYKKAAIEIDNLKIEWSEKMKILQKEGFKHQDLLNLKKDNQRLQDLHFLKKIIIACLFFLTVHILSFYNICRCQIWK